MTLSTYQNYQHYINEGWAKEPKESFKSLAGLIKQLSLPENAKLLDVGCATGELIHYLSTQFSSFSFTGMDIFDDLIHVASQLQADKTFIRGSILDKNDELTNAFDIITAIGVMSIFDETNIGVFWKNLLDRVKAGGKIIILSPLNEYGVDTMIRHRKRINGKLGEWETGWNIFSFEAINEVIQNKCSKCEFIKFNFTGNLSRKNDPVRTWTLSTSEKEKQLMNGLKLLIDHYFIVVTK